MVEFGWSEIRLPRGITKLVCEPLVLPGAHVGQIPPVRRRRRVLVQVHSEPGLTETASRLPRQLGNLVHGDPGDRNEGTDVHCPETGMLTMVVTHVYLLGGDDSGSYGTLHNGFWRTDECDDRPVGRSARVHIEQDDTVDRLDGGGDRSDDLGVSSIGEVGHTFDKRLVHSLSVSASPQVPRSATLALTGISRVEAPIGGCRGGIGSRRTRRLGDS